MYEILWKMLKKKVQFGVRIKWSVLLGTGKEVVKNKSRLKPVVIVRPVFPDSKTSTTFRPGPQPVQSGGRQIMCSSQPGNKYLT